MYNTHIHEEDKNSYFIYVLIFFMVAFIKFLQILSIQS